MDENMSRGYVLLKTNKWRYRYLHRYAKSRAEAASLAPTTTTLASGPEASTSGHHRPGGLTVNSSLSEEDEEDGEEAYLQREPLDGSSTMNPDRRPFVASSRANPANTNSSSSTIFLAPPPKDKFNGVYLGLLLAGVGFLLPYNSFVSAVDYFQARYPGSTIIFDMSFVYILVAFGAVLLNNALVESVSLYWRINFGYLISFVTLLTVTVCEVAWESFPKLIGYKLNLIAVAIVAFGCTIQQSSFYGYTSMLPARYTQAVMTGESAAGLIISINRIVTKVLISDDRSNTLMFFSVSIAIVACCVLVHNLLEKTDFVTYYVTMCSKSNSAMSTTTLTSLVGGGSIGETTPNVRNLRTGQRDRNSDNSFLTGFGKEDFDLVELGPDGSTDSSGSRYGSAGGHVNFGHVSTVRIPENHLKNVVFEPRLSCGHVRGTASSSTFRHSDSTEFDMPFGIDDEDLENYQPPAIGHRHRATNRSVPTTGGPFSRFESDLTVQEEVADDIFGHNDESANDAHQDDSPTTRGRPMDIVRLLVRAKESARAKIVRTANFLYQRSRQRLKLRTQAAALTWPFMLAIGLAYIVTLALFPGIESEITSCALGSWMPVLLMATFNLSDFLGKIAASLCYTMSPLTLVSMSSLRVFLVPLLAMAVAPRASPIFGHEFWSFLLTTLLGLSNGVFGSLPMILAPLHVPGELKEITGNLMTLSYSIGLTLGSALAYVIDWTLGPSLSPEVVAQICAAGHLAVVNLSTELPINGTQDSVSKLAALFQNATLIDIS